MKRVRQFFTNFVARKRDYQQYIKTIKDYE